MDTYIWLGAFILCLIVEAACPIHLVSIWFAVGSLAALAVSLLSGPVGLQILLFFLVSGGLLAALWPFVMRVLKPHLEKTNVDSIIGSQGYVTSPIDNVHAQGQVKLGGMEWSARSADGNAIPEGTLIRVDRIEGVKVFVTAVKEAVPE